MVTVRFVARQAENETILLLPWERPKQSGVNAISGALILSFVRIALVFGGVSVVDEYISVERLFR